MQVEYSRTATDPQAEERWLAERKNGIGASDAPKIFGLVEECMPFAWHLQKTGQAPPFKGNLATQLGHDLERTIHDLYERETGSRLVDPGDYAIIRCKEHPWLFCTPDRYAMPDTAVEMKVVFPNVGRTLADGECLLSHRVQVQVQMLCLGWRLAHVAVLNLYGPSFYIVEVPRDDQFLEVAIPELHEAWLRLQRGEPPEIDGSASTGKIVRRLHPEDNGESVELPPSWKTKLSELDKHEAEMAAAKEAADSIRNAACYFIGPNTYATLNGERVFSFKHQNNTRVLRRYK